MTGCICTTCYSVSSGTPVVPVVYVRLVALYPVLRLCRVVYLRHVVLYPVVLL